MQLGWVAVKGEEFGKIPSVQLHHDAQRLKFYQPCPGGKISTALSPAAELYFHLSVIRSI